MLQHTHHEAFPTRDLPLPAGLGLNAPARPLLVFEWIPFAPRSLAFGVLELTVLGDGGPLTEQDQLDLSLVLSGEQASPEAPQAFPGTITNSIQQAAAVAALPGVVAYTGPAVYNLAVSRSQLVAWRVRLELWGSATPARTLVVSGRLSLTVGIERAWYLLGSPRGGRGLGGAGHASGELV